MDCQPAQWPTCQRETIYNQETADSISCNRSGLSHPNQFVPGCSGAAPGIGAARFFGTFADSAQAARAGPGRAIFTSPTPPALGATAAQGEPLASRFPARVE